MKPNPFTRLVTISSPLDVRNYSILNNSALQKNPNHGHYDYQGRRWGPTLALTLEEVPQAL